MILEQLRHRHVHETVTAMPYTLLMQLKLYAATCLKNGNHSLSWKNDCQIDSVLIDNIDHNTSLTISIVSCYVIGISLFQHPTSQGQRVDHSIVILGGSASQKTVGNLPNYYMDIQPILSSTIKTSAPFSTLGSLYRK